MSDTILLSLVLAVGATAVPCLFLVIPHYKHWPDGLGKLESYAMGTFALWLGQVVLTVAMAALGVLSWAAAIGLIAGIALLDLLSGAWVAGLHRTHGGKENGHGRRGEGGSPSATELLEALALGDADVRPGPKRGAGA